MGNSPLIMINGGTVMSSSEVSQHHHSQWEPTPIEIRVCLSEKSLNDKSRFYSYISQEEGFVIPAPCFFMTTSKDNKAFRVQVVLPEKAKKDLDKKNLFSFHAVSPIGYISVVCSKLNMASALGCKIIAKLENSEVIFTISAPGQLAERKLIKSFQVFDVGREPH